MSDRNLRSGLIRLAHENPNLRGHLLPLLASTEKVAAADLVDETYGVVRDRWYKFDAALRAVLQGQLKKFAVALKKMGYTLDVTRSYADWTKDSEGAYPDFMLAFTDTKGRSVEQVEKDLKVLGVYGYLREVGGAWQVRFGGK